MASKYVATTGSDSNAGTSGSPYLTLGKAGSVIAGGDTIFQATGTYNITSATTNIVAGCLSMPAGSITGSTRLIGTDASWNPLPLNSASLPVNKGSGISSFSLVTTANGCDIENVIFDGNSLGSSTCVNASSGNARLYNVIAKNGSNGLYGNIGATRLVLCQATNCSGWPIYGGKGYGCVAYGNTAHAFRNGTYRGCISVNNTGDGFYSDNFSELILWDCLSYANSGNGFSFDGRSTGHWEAIGCHAEGNTSGAGYTCAQGSSSDFIWIVNCSSYNNLSDTSLLSAGNLINFLNNASFTGGSPLVSPGTLATANFGLNSTTGAGALLRAASLLGAFPFFTGTVGYQDVGPVRHQDPASGGGLIINPGMTGGFNG